MHSGLFTWFYIYKKAIFFFLTKQVQYYRCADKSLARPGRKQANVSVRMAWISFGALPCKEKIKLMTARVSMLLKSRASVTFFRACFLPGRAKDLSTHRYEPLLEYRSYYGSTTPCRRVRLRFFLSLAKQPLVSQGLLIIDDSRSHPDTPQSVALLWTSDQPEAETSTWQHTTLTTDIHPCPRWDSNPQSQQASGRRPTP